ncbi:MAG: hypothetical protein WC505_05405 [Patescibacteria group bacterium]
MKSFPADGNPVFIEGKAYQIRFGQCRGIISIDKAGGGVESVPVSQFDEHFLVVVPYECTRDLTRGAAHFRQKGMYYVAGDKGTGYRVFTEDGTAVSIGEKEFRNHFRQY